MQPKPMGRRTGEGASTKSRGSSVLGRIRLGPKWGQKGGPDCRGFLPPWDEEDKIILPVLREVLADLLGVHGEGGRDRPCKQGPEGHPGKGHRITAPEG